MDGKDKMIVAALIFLAVVLVFSVILWVMPKEPKQITTSKMMSTKEGREQLAEMIRTRYGRDSEISIDVCPTCEGHGRQFHESKREQGILRLRTWGPQCVDCGGTGIKGGLDYVVIDCPACGGTGEGGCKVCNGTKVVRRDKTTIGENIENG